MPMIYTHTVMLLLATSFTLPLWVLHFLFITSATRLPWVHCQLLQQPSSTSCQPSDQAALLEFYNHSGFVNLQGMWGSDINNHTKCVCDWFGVECDQHGFIVKLSPRYDLIEMGGSFELNASLTTIPWPISLAKLRFLKELELVGFYHNSPLPQEIGLLSQSLIALSLPQCKLMPPLPVAALTNLSKLSLLDLSSQGIDTEPQTGDPPMLFLGSPIPQQLCNLTTLEYLDLSVNGFALIPPCIALLPYLSHLDLSYNNLEGPSNILQQIWMSSSNLTYLDLSFNFLGGHIPPGISSTAKMSFLHLESNNLTGNIPESLGELSALTFLGLHFNNLAGNIPASFGNLTKLESLFLSHNMLSGEIPHQLGTLANIADHQYADARPLDFSFNQLSGKIPDSLGAIGANSSRTSAIAIDLSYNNLTGNLPWQLLTSSAIDRLYLQSNYLTGFAELDMSSLTALAGALVNTSSLEELDVSANELTGPIPSWIISHLSGLYFLDMSSNHLEATGFRDSSLALRTLNLSSNNLKGPIPAWLSNQSALYSLDLSFNHLEGTIPGWLWSLKIGSIYLSMNKLQGDINLDGLCFCGGVSCTLEASHNRFSRLQAPSNNSCFGLWVDLQSNHLSGLLSWHTGTHFSNTLFWDSLNLADNNFFGGLPEFPSNQSESSSTGRDLDLSHNQLSGGIPTSIGSLQLTFLRLSSNNFSGEIPISSLCNSGQLTVLKLDSNSLHGSITDEIGLCSHFTDEFGLNFYGGLTSLVLKDNLLKGFLPSALGNLSTSLQVLDLSYNSFEGEIPRWIQHMQSIRVLVLSHNGFSGHLPSTEWNTTQLQVLDLSSNKLTGRIPGNSLSLWLQGFLYSSVLKSLSNGTLYDESISIVAKDQVLNFSYLLTATVSLDLSNNDLVGPIPQELGLLDGLMFLNLSHNHLSGAIPENLGNLRQLNSLDLSHNELVGEIPLEGLCLLTFLSYVDVSDNKLSGSIPDCNQWGTFTSHSFLGNKGLCGPQVGKPCMQSKGGKAEDPSLVNSNYDADDHDEDHHELLLAIFVGLCIGFPTFLGLSMLWHPLSYRIIKASRWVLCKVDAYHTD